LRRIARLLSIPLAVACAVGSAPVPAAAGLLDSLLPKGMGAAENRCLVYGFKKQNNMARCIEVEMTYDAPEAWTYPQVDAAANRCLVLGYKDDGLAACVQRTLRGQD
jgi:hypothetical protein